MQLYLLERKENDDAGYDEQLSCVVAANNPRQARKIAQANGGDEAGGKAKDNGFWLAASNVKCSLLASDSVMGTVVLGRMVIEEPQVVLSNFRSE